MVSGSKAFLKHPFEDAIRFWIKFAHQVPTSCEPQTLHFYAVLLFWMRVLLFLDSAAILISSYIETLIHFTPHTERQCLLHCRLFTRRIDYRWYPLVDMLIPYSNPMILEMALGVCNLICVWPLKWQHALKRTDTN